MRSLVCKTLLSLVILSIVFSCSCSTTKSEPSATVVTAEQPAEPAAAMEQKPEEKPAEKPVTEIQKPAEEPAKEMQKPAEKPMTTEQKPKEQPEEATKPAVEAPADPNIVARIGDYVIYKNELEQRLLQQLSPYNYNNLSDHTKPINAETTLKEILAEKAMIIDARAKGYTEHETVSSPVQSYRDRRLANMLLQQYVQPKLNVTDEEIQEKLKADPNMDPARAKAMLQRAQANKIISEYYKQIYENSNVKKFNENFEKVVELNDRLLNHPVNPRPMQFIYKTQITGELTKEEQDIVLATYDGGKITVKDWFETLCNYSPPSRPKQVTPTVVEQLLDVSLRLPLYVKEATSKGLDKDEDLHKMVKDYEDRVLMNEVRSILMDKIPTPTTTQIIDYFNENKKAFGVNDSIKIEFLWCQNLDTAKKATAALKEGQDFESVRQQYALNKEGRANMTVNPSQEGQFWEELWAAEPNDIVGPIKGFNGQEIKWRVVKILEKIPGKEKEYTEQMEGTVKNRMISEQLNNSMDKLKEELLKQYPYQIYADRIKDIDPFNIP